MSFIVNSIRFDITLWILISAYWLTGVWNFMASMPEPHDWIEFFKLNRFSYTFRLITSLIFFSFGIIQFQHSVLSYLTVIEIIIVIITYLILITSKQKYLKKQKRMKKELDKKRNNEINGIF